MDFRKKKKVYWSTLIQFLLYYMNFLSYICFDKILLIVIDTNKYLIAFHYKSITNPYLSLVIEDLEGLSCLELLWIDFILITIYGFQNNLTRYVLKFEFLCLATKIAKKMSKYSMYRVYTFLWPLLLKFVFLKPHLQTHV